MTTTPTPDTITIQGRHYRRKLQHGEVLDLVQAKGFTIGFARSLIEGEGAPVPGKFYGRRKRKLYDRDAIIAACE
jgi:hypothetical protein